MLLSFMLRSILLVSLEIAADKRPGRRNSRHGDSLVAQTPVDAEAVEELGRLCGRGRRGLWNL